ncbi:MAG: hypothetical protein IJM82_10120 [Synergistaceae bacterium]|nr:hypothetical protein [Synergistaceae bacterium]MBQ6738586.1 hypothetical protein [Synergistaceae bacterium]MBQ7069506.1 hypothetical protein [Synergistaceae bacterium]MBR0076631.1 hypothetical protein [Synergistaceae bacterium]MBR0080814.1 hypothetical protein [Synergistaceae bacterium]
MAAVSTVTKNAVNVKLDNGSSGGEVKTVSVSLGRLGKTGFDATKAMNVAMLLGDCLSKDIYSVEHTQVSRLTEE